MSSSPPVLLEYLAKNIVDNTNSVKINESVDSFGQTNLELSVDKTDMGKIIGKGGKTIRAIRNLIKALSIKQSLRTTVNLTEEY